LWAGVAVGLALVLQELFHTCLEYQKRTCLQSRPTNILLELDFVVTIRLLAEGEGRPVDPERFVPLHYLLSGFRWLLP
jgi:hypothetical protein